MDRTLPQVCCRCHQLKLPHLGRFIQARRRVLFLCDNCDAKQVFTKGRRRRASPDERRACEALVRQGEPFVQEFPLDGFFFDFAVRPLRLLIEVDSRTWHRHPSRLARDRFKQSCAEAKGWKVVRIRRPDVAGKVQHALDMRRVELYG